MAKEKKNSTAGLFIPAGLFLGLGVGFAFGNIPIGMFMGLGVGFLLFALIQTFKK